MELKSCIPRSLPLQIIHLLNYILREALSLTYEVNLHVGVVRSLYTVNQVLSEKIHDTCDFLNRPLPVLRGKSIHCKILYSKLIAIFTYSLKSLRALCVSIVSGKKSLLCPSAISIHDHSHMLRHIK